MGYCTYYRLKMQPQGPTTVPRCQHERPARAKFCPECGQSTEPVELLQNVKAWLCLEKEKDSAYAYGVDHEGEPTESCKWYEWEADIRRLSKQFPDVLFTLSGEGEESGDIWKAYFLGGKMHKEKAVIQVPPFDKKKLK